MEFEVLRQRIISELTAVLERLRQLPPGEVDPFQAGYHCALDAVFCWLVEAEEAQQLASLEAIRRTVDYALKHRPPLAQEPTGEKANSLS